MWEAPHLSAFAHLGERNVRENGRMEATILIRDHGSRRADEVEKVKNVSGHPAKADADEFSTLDCFALLGKRCRYRLTTTHQ